MNQLARSNSAYLQQHAHNPVDWWPWGAEALESAASQGQWLLVSIGYSTCHWCHVMEREIFEDADCASFMNAHFKNIKVDREERPDLDHAYMQAALALNGQGGWPLNVICLPDGRPVWASTYLPKERWLGALQRLVDVQKNQREVAGPYAQRLTEALEAAGNIPTPPTLEIPPLDDSITASESSKWDLDHGGFRGAPKFPLPSHWWYLMELSISGYKWPEAYSQAKKTLGAIFYSGSYDSVRGGLFRYSTDGVWKVPHFEKMAYDNGLWLRLCAQLYAHDQQSIYATAFERTTEWLLREMRLEDGLFAAAMDADTDGIEGGSFTWTLSDLESALGQAESRSFLQLLESQGAAWDQRWIIHWHPSQGLPTEAWLQYVAALRPAALARTLPFRDPKCIQAWNAWLVSGLTEGALHFPSFGAIARDAAESHWAAFKPGAKGCPHVKYPGLNPTGQAFLDDLAASAHACISMAQWSGETQWLERASTFVHAAERHWTGKAYQFSAQHQDDPAFLAHFDWEDDVLPSAQSTMASCLLRLGHLLGRLDWTERASLLVASALSHPSLPSDRAWSWWALAPWTRPDAEHLVLRAGICPENRPQHPLWGPGDLPTNVYGQVCTMQACTLVLNSKSDLDAYLLSR